MTNDESRFNDARILTPFNPDNYTDHPFKWTIGPNKESRNWRSDDKTPDVATMFLRLSQHREDKNKDGLAFVTGDMAKGQRLKTAVKALYAIGLDFDKGTPPEKIDAAMIALGCAAIRYTTHSNGKTRELFKRDEIVKWLRDTGQDEESEIDTDLMRRYLLEKKGWDPAHIPTVEVIGIEHETRGVMVHVSMAPMHKNRVVIPLAEPFVIRDIPGTQNEAIAKWAKVPVAMAELMGLGDALDRSGTDTSRLFFFPRHAPNMPWEITICGGDLFDVRSLELENPYLAAAQEVQGRSGGSKSKTDAGRALASWSRTHAQGFQIADLLRDHAPEKIRGNGSNGPEIVCPFDDGHSNPGDPDDRACMVTNAGDSSAPVFSIKCQHDSCREYTNLDMLGRMLADGWFPRELIDSDDYNPVVGDAPHTNSPGWTDLAIIQAEGAREWNTRGVTVERVRADVVALAPDKKPDAESLTALLDKIAGVSDAGDRNLMFDVVAENVNSASQKIVSRARTEAKKAWSERSKPVRKSAPRSTPDLPLPERLDVVAKTGEIKDTFENCLILLEDAHGEAWGFAYDEFAQVAVLRGKDVPWAEKFGRELDDAVIRIVRHFLIEQWGVTFTKTDVEEACLTLASYNRFNPLVEYLDGLEWDGVPRLATLLVDYFGAEDTEYVRAVGIRWPVAAVRRAKKPGTKFDNMLIFEGPGGLGKSTALKKLAGDEYFSDAPLGDVENKDAAIILQNVWIGEMGELSNMNRSETEAMLAFVSREVDHYRSPFDKRAKKHPRMCVFAGTTNKDNYLTATTGNRRYWPVKCSGEIKLDALARDRDQIWAEAVVMEASGMSLFLPKELWETARGEQEARVAVDPWRDDLLDYLESLACDRVSTQDLLKAVVADGGQKNDRAMKRLRDVMATIPGWEHKTSIRFKQREGADKVRAGYERVAKPAATDKNAAPVESQSVEP
jgi:predicted P-loop ATPase